MFCLLPESFLSPTSLLIDFTINLALKNSYAAKIDSDMFIRLFYFLVVRCRNDAAMDVAVVVYSYHKMDPGGTVRGVDWC